MIEKAPENQPTSASPNTASATAAKTAKKPRSPVERIVVWGGILVMLVLLGWQYYAKSCFQQTSDRLNAALAKADTDDDAKDAERLYDGTVKKLLVGNPKLTESNEKTGKMGVSKIDTYTWSGPFKPYSLEITFGASGTTARDAAEVLSITAK